MYRNSENVCKAVRVYGRKALLTGSLIAFELSQIVLEDLVLEDRKIYFVEAVWGLEQMIPQEFENVATAVVELFNQNPVECVMFAL